MRFLAICVLAVASSISFGQEKHAARDIEGWTVNIDERLFNTAIGDRARRVLADQLFAIKDRVPPDKVAKLRKVVLWLDLDCKGLERPQYHPSAEWLKENGYPVDHAKCVHIPNVDYFASARFQVAQPFAVLHELAHAYHDQVLGFDNPEIMKVWKDFCADKKHQSVLRYSGRMEPHYGLTDQKEFFAEMTESYFGTNDFYPFVRAELQRDEPEAFALMKKIWGD